MFPRDPDGLWSSSHSGAWSLRGTITMLALAALLGLVFLLTDWLWGAILGFLAAFFAVLWFIFSWEEIVRYARDRPVLRVVLGVIFLALGVGTLLAILLTWESQLDPTRERPPGSRPPAVAYGFLLVIAASCLVAGGLLLWRALSRRR